MIKENYVGVHFSKRALAKFLDNGNDEIMTIWSLPDALLNVKNIDELKTLSSKWDKITDEEFVSFIKYYTNVLKFKVSSVKEIIELSNPEHIKIVQSLFTLLEEAKLMNMNCDLETLDLPKGTLPILLKAKNIKGSVTYHI